MHFKIIIPCYNVEKWIQRTINSVHLQTYQDYEVVLIDDISTDRTRELIERLVPPQWTTIFNTEKKYALGNIVYGIENCNRPIKDEDVIINLDGDDWFAQNKTLEILNSIYEKEECLMTYGSYIEYPSGCIGKFSKRIPNNIIEKNSFREFEWCSSHLRSYKYKLWKNIDKNDLKNEKNYFTFSIDLAIMFPLLEMSGKKSRFVSDILYVYNRDNPLNEDKINHNFQLEAEFKIRNKKKYLVYDL